MTLTEEQWARMPWHARQRYLDDLTHTWRALARNIRDALETQRTTLTWMGTDDTPERHRARYEDVFDGWYRCLVCGETVRGWYFGSRDNPSWGLRKHPPGQGLVDPCEWHGHLSLVLAKDGPTAFVTCRCKTLRRTR